MFFQKPSIEVSSQLFAVILSGFFLSGLAKSGKWISNGRKDIQGYFHKVSEFWMNWKASKKKVLVRFDQIFPMNFFNHLAIIWGMAYRIILEDFLN